MNQKGKTRTAKAKLKKNVCQRGHLKNFSVTPSFICYWWRVINAALFDNTLRQPKSFESVNWKDGSLGECVALRRYSKKSQIIIRINSSISDRKTALNIIAHEMVHQWEQQTFGRMSHGKNFQSWQKKFKSVGLDLQKEY